jgi:hypothetical protein
LLTERYGDLDTAWKKAFDKDLHDSIVYTELRDACGTLGYPHDTKALFKALHPPGRNCITIWDLDPVASRKKLQGKDEQHEELAQSRDQDVDTNVADDGLGVSNVLASSSGSNFRSRRPQSAADVATTVRNMHLALKQKHGTSAAAWRAHFDPQLSGKVSFGKFVIVLEDCSFFGNVKQLWKELAGEKTTVTFRDLDPEAASMLDEFREAIVTNCGSILKAWQTFLDTDGAGRVDAAEFLVKMVGKVKNPKKVFKLLLARHGQRSIVAEDLEILLLGIPAGADRKMIWAGGTNQAPSLQENLASSPHGSPMGNSRSSPMGKAHGSPHGSPMGMQEASPRHFSELVLTRHHTADMICNDLTHFKKILVVKYGSLFSAWRKLLDFDQNGVVTHRDFANACQSLGVQAIAKIWAEFDKNRDGQISLKEVDADCAALFNPLEQLLIEKYGSTKEGWRNVFDKEGSLTCEQDKFVERCQAIGFAGDAEKLFKLLRPEAGRAFLTYDDLWINVNINEFKLNKPEPNNTQGSPRSVRSPSHHSPHGTRLLTN